MIQKEFVALGLSCGTQEEVLRALAKLLEDGGAVRGSFADAVVAREKVYPTGLPAKACDVAIPHTFSEHVVRPALAVATLREPVDFAQMGSPNITLKPQLIIMMAIRDAKEQLQLLKRMMKLLQNEEQLKAIRYAQNEQAVVDLLTKALEAN